MLNLVLRGSRNFDVFNDLYSRKRHFPSEEKKAIDAFKTISLRNKDNALVYDFTSLSVRKVTEIFSEDEEISFSNSPYFRIVLKQNIEKERSKGTPSIIIKAEPRDCDVINMADKCGFRRVASSWECVTMQLHLGVDVNRE